MKKVISSILTDADARDKTSVGNVLMRSIGAPWS